MPESYKPIRQHPYKVYQEEQLRNRMAEFNQVPNSVPLRTCGIIVLQARQEGKWIYDPKSHEWYSPEEFHKAFDKIRVGCEPLFARVQIKDPKEGIEAGYKVITKMQSKWNDLIQRVLAWEATERVMGSNKRA